MNEPEIQSDFTSLMQLVQTAGRIETIFPYLSANAQKLKTEARLFLEYAGTNQTLFYERLLASALVEYLDSGIHLDSFEQARKYAEGLKLEGNKIPSLIKMLQSIWHLRTDPTTPSAAVNTFTDRVAILVSLYNETRFCELALKSVRIYAGMSHYLVVINNSTRDVSDFRRLAQQKGLFDAWLDSGLTHHGLGLQKALANLSPFRYVMTFDSDAAGIKAGWLRDLILKMKASDAALIGPRREPSGDTVIGAAVHPCCLVIDRKRIGTSFKTDFRGFWPFWDVGGLLTLDCMAHSLPIASLSHDINADPALASSQINGTVRHYWYVSRIADLEDNAILDGHKVGDIRTRLNKEYAENPLTKAEGEISTKVPQQHRMPLLSVVLTTHNRQALLKNVLEGFAAQSAPIDQWELIVIDDGSLPPVKELVESFADRLQIRYFYQMNAGLAAARNVGVRLAQGRYVFFHDDDDLPHTDVIAEHIASHIAHPEENIAVLGHWDWHKDLKVTPLMHYIIHQGGHYFGYDGMTSGFFYEQWKWWGGQISAKTSLLRSVDGPFDERFTYGHEDTELVCRLLNRGISILYNAGAKKFILRSMSLKDFCARRIKQGRALFHLAAKHPDIAEQRYHLKSAAVEYKTQFHAELDILYKLALQYDESLSPVDEQIQNVWQRCFRGYLLKGYLEEADAVFAGKSAMMEPVVLNAETKTAPVESSVHPPVQPIIPIETGLKKPSVCINMLFICPALPRPDIGSSNVRVHNILKLLSEQGHKIKLFYFGQTEEDEQYTRAWENRISIEHLAPRSSDLIERIRTLPIKPDCVWITNLWNPAFCESMHKVVTQLKPLLPDARIVIDTMDHHARKYQRQFQHSRNEKDLAISGQFADIEARLYGLADRVVVVTQAEKMSIEASLPGCSFAVIPNIHILNRNNPGFHQRDNICFIGSLQIRHNADAVKWFIGDILPQIQRHRTATEFHIMGYGTDKYRDSLSQYEGVKVLGYVDDAEEAVSKYKVFACPLLYGAGLKGKLGTAVAAGTPFVTTSMGAEGFDLDSGEDCFICDMADEFAEKCLTLLDNEAIWTQFSNRAKKHFEELFSPQAVSPLLRELIKELAPRQHATPSEVIPVRISPERVAALLDKGRTAELHRSTIP